MIKEAYKKYIPKRSLRIALPIVCFLFFAFLTPSEAPTQSVEDTAVLRSTAADVHTEPLTSISTDLVLISPSPTLKPHPASLEPTPEATPEATPEPVIPEDSGFEIFYLDVGEGDSSVILCDGHAMLIDGGKPEKSDLIYSFLQKHDIKYLDYIICSHSDADHVGGLSGALNYADAGNILCTEKHRDTDAFNSFERQVSEHSLEINVPYVGTEFSLGTAEVYVLSPHQNRLQTENSSLILKIQYGKTAFLFTGDAEIADEQTLLSDGLDIDSTVLKVAHHGSNTSTSQEFLDAVSPKYAVISVGGDNNYGHPSSETLDKLREAKILVYRTDMHGMTSCTSDGETVKFVTEKEAVEDVYGAAGGYKNYLLKLEEQLALEQETAQRSMQKDTAASLEASQPTPSPTQEPIMIDYVLNTNTRKFHYPSCASAKQIKSGNRQDYSGTRDEVISMGYTPCKKCNP